MLGGWPVNHFAVSALQGLAEHVRGAIEIPFRVFNAVDRVMSVLPLEALIKVESLQARETHQIGVPHHFDGDARVTEEFCPNLRELVHFEDDGRMRDVERGNVAVRGQGLNPATGDIRRVVSGHSGTSLSS